MQLLSEAIYIRFPSKTSDVRLQVKNIRSDVISTLETLVVTSWQFLKFSGHVTYKFFEMHYRGYIIDDEAFVIYSVRRRLNKRLEKSKVHLSEIEAVVFQKLQRSDIIIKTDCNNLITKVMNRKYRVHNIKHSFIHLRKIPSWIFEKTNFNGSELLF